MLLTANQRKSFTAEGRYVFVRSCSASVLLTLYPSGDQITLGYGEMYDIGERDQSKYFTRMDVYNTSDADNNVELEAGYEAFHPAPAGGGNEVVIAGTTLNLPVEVKQPVDVNPVQVVRANSSPSTPDVILPPGETTQVLAANSKRKKVIIFAGENNIQNLRIGFHAAVGANNGGILAPGGNGEIDEFDTGVWIYNPGTADETVCIIELENI